MKLLDFEYFEFILRYLIFIFKFYCQAYEIVELSKKYNAQQIYLNSYR